MDSAIVQHASISICLASQYLYMYIVLRAFSVNSVDLFQDDAEQELK